MPGEGREQEMSLVKRLIARWRAHRIFKKYNYCTKHQRQMTRVIDHWRCIACAKQAVNEWADKRDADIALACKLMAASLSDESDD